MYFMKNDKRLTHDISEFTSSIRFLKRLLERKEFTSGKNSQEHSEIDKEG